MYESWSRVAASEIAVAGYSVRGLANWVLDFADEYGVGVSNMALNKLLFFGVEAVLLKEGRLLTKAKIEAWEHGPVFREVYHAFKNFNDRPITGRVAFFSVVTGKQELSTVSLTVEDEATLREALGDLVRKSASELRRISHLPNGAWSKTWWYEGHANPGMEISPESILGR